MNHMAYQEVIESQGAMQPEAWWHLFQNHAGDYKQYCDKIGMKKNGIFPWHDLLTYCAGRGDPSGEQRAHSHRY